MELLSPAGNLEKLKYAYSFGADAAYMGISNFSLRSKAENLSSDEYAAIAGIKGNRKLYAALNIYFHDQDIRSLEENLDYISLYPFDAFIISDIGILPLLKKRFPSTPLHLSTQANCVNSEAAKMYRDLGFSRIVPGRELSLREIEQVKRSVDIEVEVFVHGAMCLAYSGRCILSSYMSGRSANKGDCSHSCRWRYRVLEEEERRGEYYPVVEGENFTTILSSKDLCMIDHLRELQSAGVDALKIEGRMKSIYYTAIVTRAYRNALDQLDGTNTAEATSYREELFNVSHRELSTGFYFGREKMEVSTRKSYMRGYDFLGIIGIYVSEGTYSLDVKNQIRQDDELEYVGYDTLYICDRSFRLLDEMGGSLQKIDHGKAGFIRTDKPVKEGYLIRRKAYGSSGRPDR
ncbi:MAG TPA: U32 family peptidase C-terminal domain-containing protein [Spirochaetia bacterium]|nr:U32 family peptidase C-terminal domain-containing protein [Spirochaetia bacterium]